MFVFTPFEIALTHLNTDTFGSFISERKEKRKLKGDGRSIGQEEKREGASRASSG